MPVYQYYCADNDRTVELFHRMSESLSCWAEVCQRAGIDPGPTPPEAPVERLLFPVATHTPAGNSKLKEQGFTKLVRRDKGVYENVTATDGEARYMRADDPSTMPALNKKIGS